MAQVTIYLPSDHLAAAKVAATEAKLSMSQWFAKLAAAEIAVEAPRKTWDELFVQLDAARATQPEAANEFDFLLDPATRDADLPLPPELPELGKPLAF